MNASSAASVPDRPADREDDPRGSDEGRARHGPRIALGVLLTLLTYALFPAIPSASVPVYDVGAVARENVIAPFSFQVMKTDDEVNREREALAGTVQPVYVFTPAALDTARQRVQAFADALDTAFAVEPSDSAAIRQVAARFDATLTAADVAYLSDSTRRANTLEAVSQAYGRWLASGVAATGALDGINGEVLVRRGQVEHVVLSDSVRTYAEFAVQARALQPDASAAGRATYNRMLRAFFRPTIVADLTTTHARRDQLASSVPLSKFDVKTGEKIVGANEVVGAAAHDKLVTLHQMMSGRSGVVPAVRRALGVSLYDALLITLLGLTVLIFRPHVYESMRSLVVVAGVTGVVIIGGALVAHIHPLHPGLIPVGIAAIVVSALFDQRIAMIVAVLLAALIGGQAAFRGTDALYVNIIGGSVAAFSVRTVRNRQQTYFWILTIGAAYCAAAVAIGLTLDLPNSAIFTASGYGVLNAVISVVAALLVLPLAERFTGVETDLTLLEWSDLNRPLLQRLSLEAPGTFAHSMQIASLAEAGCRAIGANALLARVGAYYHDIGKLIKPQYFVENQAKGRNPHDELKPLQSAQIIRNHVREGLQLAEEQGVPRALRAFIAEHHGTGTVTYFLERAKAQGQTDLQIDDYRYPGPIPQSAETGILMLADGAEAAVRVLSDPTPERIRGVVDHIVTQRMEQGQLRGTPLTLRQLERVKDEFARVLSGLHHARIEYPASSGGVSSGFIPR